MALINSSASRIVLISIVLLIILSVSALGQKWGKVSDAEWEVGPPEDYPDINAIILFNNGITEITNNYIETTQHIRIKILNKAGIEEIGDLEVEVYKDDKLKELKAHTITPDGKKHKVNKKQIFTKTLGSYEYKTFSFPNLDSGCVIEYKSRIRNERFGRLDPWYFQSDIYTLYSKICMKLHPGFNYSTATMNVPTIRQKPVEEVLGQIPRIVGYTWEMENLPPIKDEPYMSFAKNYIAAIYNQLVSWRGTYESVNFIKDWPTLGEAVQRWLDEMTNNDKKFRQLAESITTGITGDLNRAEALYEYVRDSVKTWVDPDDDRSLWDKKIWEFAENKHASRDGKNLLMAKLLKEAGFEAWTVYIGDRDGSIFVPQLVQLEQFENFVTLIQIDTLAFYLDASSKYLPFGVLSPDYRMTGGLKIDGKKSHLVRLFISNPSTSRNDVTAMSIDMEGFAACSTTIALSGYSAYWFGENYFDSDDKDQYIDDFLFDDFDGTYEIDSHTVAVEDVDLIKVRVYFTLEEFTRSIENNLLVRQLQFRYANNPFKSTKRLFPVDFNYPRIYQNSIKITCADSIQTQTLPESINLSIPGANFTRTCMYDGTSALLQNSFVIDKPVFMHNEYDNLKNLFGQIATASEDEFIFEF